jgi:hypothetical protein
MQKAGKKVTVFCVARRNGAAAMSFGGYGFSFPIADKRRLLIP